MISEIKVSGIKSFSGTAKMKLAPITIITGTNSSGKSTIFQSVLLLKQAFESPPTTLAGLYLNGRYVSVGSYQDWSFRHKNQPIHIAIQINESQHASRVLGEAPYGIPFASRNALFQPQWWNDGYYWSDYSEDAEVRGLLSVDLAAADSSPNSARLTGLSWTATIARGTWSQKNSYLFDVTAAEVDSEESRQLGPLVPSTVNLTQFPFWLNVEPSIHVRRPGSREQVEVTRLRCSVEGLAPADGLVPVGEPAEQSTMRRALATVLSRISAKPAERHRATGKRVRMLTRLPMRTDGRKFFDRTVRFVRDSPQEMFVTHVIDHSDELAEWFVSGLLTSSRTAQAAERLAKSAYFRRFKALIPTADSKVTLDSVTADSVALLSEKFRHWRAILQLLQHFMEGDLDGQVQVLVRRAAKEAREYQRALLPRSAETWDRFPRYGDEEDRCPTEQAASRFLKDFLYHLGPLRDEPRNIYASEPPQAAHDVGQRGERAINCIRWFGSEVVLAPAGDDFPPRAHQVTLHAAVVQWGKYLGIFEDLLVDTSTKYGTVCKIIGTNEDFDVQADLTNVGVGVSQLLPVIVLCLASPIGSTVLIEQPELHLHPSIQSRLATFFAVCALTGRQIVVETHSEHLINRIRLIIAKKRLDSKRDVSIVFVERDDGESSISRIEVREDGGIERWPRGFNDEAELALKEIMEARFAGRSKS